MFKSIMLLLYFKYGQSCYLPSLNNELLMEVLLPKVPLEFSFRHAKLRKNMAFFFFIVYDGHFEFTL